MSRNISITTSMRPKLLDKLFFPGTPTSFGLLHFAQKYIPKTPIPATNTICRETWLRDTVLIPIERKAGAVQTHCRRMLLRSPQCGALRNDLGVAALAAFQNRTAFLPTSRKGTQEISRGTKPFIWWDILGRSPKAYPKCLNTTNCINKVIYLYTKYQ
ncbi:hypothetical protein E1B28_008621 [Marasmius oreades]|uniref:Uncharacterized protein n=1 Tax=Marasmius oreades TaxID=181124 RepID=A0A9P7RZF1_9AGAR|nr:uncharacterized protein E1B28_008621 [Marasmius oreades]KAG7092257.1 hypothetical protein E1B28_008621 [Marasmius oreades]